MIRRLRLLVAGFLLVGALGAAGGSTSAFTLFGDPCKNAPDATVCQEEKKSQTNTDNSLYGPNGIVGKIVTILAFVIGVASVIVIIIAGIQYMTSTGDSTKVNNAKNALLYAVIGLIVAVLAQSVVFFIIKKAV